MNGKSRILFEKDKRPRRHDERRRYRSESKSNSDGGSPQRKNG
jgi:hypothetical protein